MLLVLLLMISFSLLPYLTGRLMESLNASTKYQRCRVDPPARGQGHLLFLGALDGAAITRVRLLLLLLLCVCCCLFVVDGARVCAPPQNPIKKHKKLTTKHKPKLKPNKNQTKTKLMDEVYHEDKGYDQRHVAFLCPAPPSRRARAIITSHRCRSRMHYVQGSPFRPHDLQRACAEHAEAVFIVANKHPADVLEEGA